MCLAIPGKVLSISEDSAGLAQAEVSFDGVRRKVCLVYTPEARVGDHVLVHAGVAITCLDEEAAQRMLDTFRPGIGGAI